MKSFGIAAVIAVLVSAQPTPTLAQATQSAGLGGQIAGACGQPDALTYKLPAPLDQTPAAPLSLVILRGEPAYLEFTLTADARLVLRTETEGGEVDPYLALFSATGAVLGEDDDSAGNYNAMVDTSLPPGTYCAQVRPYAAGAGARQQMTLLAATGAGAEELAGRPIPASGEGTDTTALCTDPAQLVEYTDPIAPGVGRLSLPANIAVAGRQDWRFSVTEEIQFQADATSDAFDTTLTLADGNGAHVADNDDGPNMGTGSRIAIVLQPGIYCLSLAAFDGAGGAAEVVLTDTPDSPIMGDVTTACTDPALTSDFGATLAPGLGYASVAGHIVPGTRSDWTVDVSEMATFQFDLSSGDSDPVLTLLDASGNILDTNDDGPSGTDSRIVAELSSGRYCLAAEVLGGGEGNFELSATDDVEAAPMDPFQVDPCSAPEMTLVLDQPVGPGLGVLDLSTVLASGARQDWSLTVAAETTLRFDAKSGEFDTTLRLSDAMGTAIAENDDAPGGTTDSQIETVLAPGSYCLSLEGFAGSGGAAEVAMTEVDAAEIERLSGERGEVIPVPESGAEIEDLGTLDAALQTNAPSPDLTKWMAFTLADAGTVKINAVSASGSFTLRLFTEAGELVQEVPGAPGFSPATLSADLSPGRYLVGMSLDAGASGRLRNVMISRQ